MPQVDIKYSESVTIASTKLFDVIESTINEFDQSAGNCKSRAYKTNEYKHDHIYISIKVLQKPHRDQMFMEKLLEKLQSEIQTIIPENCYFAIELDFISPYYLTQ